MILTVATTHQPASDLGYLLMKNPARTWEGKTSHGRVTVFWTEATEERATAALALEVDPVALVRGERGREDAYVNDRPFVANSYLSVAIAEAFGTALSGRSRERQELAETAIPLEIEVACVRGPADRVEGFFAPLGWTVTATPVGTGRYCSLSLRGTRRLQDALAHLLVLLPALDDRTHYFVGENEIGSLLARGEGWLDVHPERDAILGRSLRRKRDLVDRARELLNLPPPQAPSTDPKVHDARLDHVASLLANLPVSRIVDLGCGEGRLLQRLIKDGRYAHLTGVDPEMAALERAKSRLYLDDASDKLRERLTLLQGSATLPDARLIGADAIVLAEVVEHLDPERLPNLEEAVFAAARPAHVLVTTPNRDHNVLFPGLPAGAMRHPDHRFEWSREELRDWATGVASRHGYSVTLDTWGDVHPEHGGLTSVAIFAREAA